jgi:hypothetical protein
MRNKENPGMLAQGQVSAFCLLPSLMGGFRVALWEP